MQVTQTSMSIQTQFLCAVPIKKIQWKDTLNNLSWDDQKHLLDATVNLPILQKFPLDANYIVRFLRFVIDQLEKQNLEVHDDLYTTLCSYQAKINDSEEYSYKHYQVVDEVSENVKTVVLKENRNKISQGTTGLNVWESALALSEWAIQNKHFFCDKHILELGAGTGLSSLIISKACLPKSVHITDGNDKVIENLLENVANNFQNADDGRFCLDNDGKLDVVKLDWSNANESYIRSHWSDIDLIIGADIIYDDSLFDSLLSTVQMLFECCDKCERFILVNAVRNPQTEQTFLNKLCKEFLTIPSEFKLQYIEEPFAESYHLFWEANDFSPIKLYSISKKNEFIDQT